MTTLLFALPWVAIVVAVVLYLRLRRRLIRQQRADASDVAEDIAQALARLAKKRGGALSHSPAASSPASDGAIQTLQDELARLAAELEAVRAKALPDRLVSLRALRRRTEAMLDDVPPSDPAPILELQRLRHG